MDQAIEAIESLSEERLSDAIQRISNINSQEGPFRESLLHKTVQKNWKTGSLILLRNHFNVRLVNSFGQTCLHYAVTLNNLELVRLLIEEGSKDFINDTDRRGHSPLHDAAALGFGDIVQELLEAGALVNESDNNGLTPLHKAIFARDPKTVYHLLAHGANIEAEDYYNGSALSLLLSTCEDLFMSVLDLCFSECEDKIYEESRIKIKFYPLFNSSNSSELNVIREILKNGSLRMASHPLCEIFLLLQWISLRKYFVVEVFLYFLFTIVATVLILNKFIWSRYEGFSFISSDSFTYKICFSLLASGTILMLLRQFFIFINGIKIRFISAWYILNLIVPILVLVVITGDYSPWQDHLAVITIFFSWSQGMLHIGRFPKWGIYITMFSSVAKNLLRMFLIFFCVFVAFTLSFNIICLSKPSISGNVTSDETYFHELTDEEALYANIWFMMLKTLTMMIGELNFGEDVIQILRYLPGTAYCLYVTFIFLMSIILSNLLVALAVNDVQELKNKAQVEKLFKEAEVAELMETTCNVVASICKKISLQRLSKFFQFSTFASDDSKVSIKTNDYLKNGCLILKKNKEVKVISMTPNFVEKVSKCLKNNFEGRDKEEEANLESGGASFEDIIKNMKTLNQNVCDILSRISKIEGTLKEIKEKRLTI
ncbi:UNVERIFIED_CONTAM: hypothetical protein RMT77_002161 [Armadillidium vulgare]